MLKFIAAFSAPFVLSLFFIKYNLFNLIFIHNRPLSFSIDGFLLVYIFTLPAYLLIGVPASIIIERINKGMRCLNYSLAEIIGELIVIFINSTQDYKSALAYSMAGFSFYCILRILELIDHSIKNREGF